MYCTETRNVLPKKSGSVCAAKNCRNKSYTSPEKRFFKFRTDPATARTWALACGRDDLLEKADSLYKSYKLCSDHFEDHMFSDLLRSRLKFDAHPTIFPVTETCNRNDHNYTRAPIFKTEYSDTQLDLTRGQAVVPETEKVDDSLSFLKNEKQSDCDAATETNSAIDQTELKCPEIMIDSDSESKPTILEGLLSGTYGRDNSEINTDSSAIPINLDGSLSSNSSAMGSNEASFINNPDFPLRQMKTQPSKAKMGSQPEIQTFLNIVPVVQLQVVPGMPLVFVGQQPYVHVQPVTKKGVQCRTCGGIFKEEECQSISDVPENSSETIKELLNKCVPSICSKLNNTEHICGKCIKDLKICVDFIEKCLSTDKALQEQLYNISVDQLRDCIETPYVCNKCSTKFSSLAALMAHQEKMKDSPTCTFSCEKCRKVFRNPLLYRRHFKGNTCRKELLLEIRRQKSKARRQEREEIRRRELEIEEEREREWRKKAFLCDVCGKTFPTQGMLNSHNKAHWAGKVKTVCPECGKVISAPALRQHMKLVHGPKDTTKRFMCDQCPKLFKKRIILEQHQDFEHKNVIKYRCDECNMNFRMPYNLKSHMITKHSNEKPYKCEPCNVSFARNDYYKRHLNSRQHKLGIKSPNGARVSLRKKERPCVCKYCNKVFKSDHNLKLHYHSHLNYRPHKCSYCSLRFTNYQLRDRHQKTHEDPSGHFRCDICYNKFSDKESLTAHKSKHKLHFKCEYCDEGFGRKYLLENHLANEHSDNKEEEQLRRLLKEEIQYVNDVETKEVRTAGSKRAVRVEKKLGDNKNTELDTSAFIVNDTKLDIKNTTVES